MKRFNTYNPYARLPKAQDGMNVRGNRNQLAQKETTTKNVGTWFEDAGKWVLNTLASPFELISGTNFYDPEMAHSGWQQFDDVSEGVVKGVGDALGYVYGGPMYGAAKAGISGIADAAGAKDDVARMSVQYGGRLQKAQNSQTLPGTNQMNIGFPNGAAGAAQMGQVQQGVNGVINGTQHFCPGGNCLPPTAGGQTPMGSPGGGGQTPQMPGAAGGQPPVGQAPTNGQDYFTNMQNGAQYMSDPGSAQGWSGAVMDAASDPVGAITNMVGGFANAGKDPVVAKDSKTYRDITANTGSHPGDLAKSMGDIITGVDPTEYAYTKKHEDNAMRMKNASKQMRAVGNIGSGGIPSQYGGRAYQMGGTVVNPYMKSQMAQENARAQGGMENMAGKVGAAIQHAGGVVGESLSGMGMGGGGGGGGMGGMMGGMMGGGGGMGGMMDMFGGGEGGGGFDMNSIMGMFGGGGAGGDAAGGFEHGGRIPKAQGGKKVRSYVDSLQAHNSGSELLEEFLSFYPEVELDTIQGPFENNHKGHFNGGTRENMKPTAKIVRKDRRDNDPNNTNLFHGNLVSDLYDKPTNIPKRYKEEEHLRSTYQQYGGRSKKYQNGDEVRPEDMPRKATAADMKRIDEWFKNTEMVETPYPPTDSTYNPYYNIMNEIDSLSATPQRSNEDFLDQPFQYGGIPKAQMGGGLMSMLGKAPGMDMIQKLMGGLGGGGGQGGGQGGGGMGMSSIMEKMQNMDPEQWKAIQGMFKDGFSAEGLGNAIGGSAGEGIGGIVGGFMGGGGGGATKQNGGRLAKTSNLPMDMEGFTDLDQGFNRSNTIEINSGNNHSDLDNPHTPLNIPVPSFDEQGNAMTENVQILAEKGEFARKDPDTEAVTIFSKNLKTKDSSGKRTNYAKIAEKLGKKEERLTTQAKNPFDDIADASIQRALNNVKNKFIRLEEEQKVAKEVKEEEDRMDLMQLAKNGGRITKKNTYRMGGKVKTLSEYQKELIGMDDSMPKAQYSLPPEDMYDRIDQLGAEEGNPYKKKRKTKAEKQKERETRRNLRELEKQQIKGEGPLQTIEEESGIATDNQKPSDLAKQIKELDEGKEFGSLNLYPNTGVQKADELLKEQARKQKQQEAEEDYEFYSNLSKTGGTPKTQEEGLPQPPIEEEEYSTAPEEETGEQQQQQRGASGDSAINDYINNLRGINSEVEQGLTPYQNYFEDYGRETENIMRNTANDLPRYYEDRAAHLNAANVNAAENQVRNMSGMGSSGYLANMQALKNKELRANNDFLAQSQGQEDARLGKLAEMIGQHRQIEATGATVADDRTREAEDALYSARYDTEKNILTGRLAQTNEANTARRNELLDSQMQWMYNNDRTQYDKDGNPVNPDPATKQYGGSIKRDMYEYGSRVKREKQMKSDRAMNDFRSFMSDYNKK